MRHKEYYVKHHVIHTTGSI